LAGPEGHVFAAEPNPSVRNRLVENIAINRMKHIEILPWALGATAGTVDFHGPDAADSESGSGHVMPASAGPSAGTMRVEMRRIDDFTEAAQVQRLDLIKIDVEGYEWPALCGGEQTLARFRPHVVFEFDRAYAGRGGGDPVAITAYFTRHRYKLYAVGRIWARKVTPENWPNAGNLWAVPSA
jgi:FkbM family methyltransferase